MGRAELLIFDFDGTLADTREDIAAAANHVISWRALPPLSVEAVTSTVGQGARFTVRASLVLAGEAEPDAVLDEAMDRFMRYYRDHPCDHTHLYPGMEAALDELTARGIALGVATNKPANLALAALEKMNALGRFDQVLGGDMGIALKPDPAMVRAIQEHHGVGDEGTVFVGDMPPDARVAHAAGVRFLAVLWGYSPESELGPHAWRIVRHPREMIEAVRAGDPPGSSAPGS